MISIRGLEFHYIPEGNRQHAPFSVAIGRLEIPQGAHAALVGPSGSGKTTLLNLVAGILEPGRGSIKVCSTRLDGLPERERSRHRIRNIGQVFQSFELLDYLTVGENVQLPWFIDGRASATESRRKIAARATELLTEVGLGDRIRSMPGELSQGEKQRVAVCRAMLNRPPLLLADEPTGNLDLENKQTVVDLLREQARANRSTLVMVTHDLGMLDGFDLVLDMQDISRAEDAA